MSTDPTAQPAHDADVRLVTAAFPERRVDLRIAVLSDIHGNQPALSAVLRDIETRGADRVIVNGDVVNRGPDGVEVMHTLLSLGVSCTLGNHDALMRLWWDRDPEIPDEWFEDPFFDSFTWCARQLHDADLLKVIDTWPMTLRIEEPGAPVVIAAHGTPDHYREGIGRRMAEDRMSDLLRTSGAGVLVGSHTHVPGVWERPEGLLVNTGAVGAPFNRDERAQYLLLDLVEGRWVPQLRYVPYDLPEILRRYDGSGLIAGGHLSAHIFREELRTAYPLYARFWEWTETHDRPRDWAAWAEFDRDVAPAFLVRS